MLHLHVYTSIIFARLIGAPPMCLVSPLTTVFTRPEALAPSIHMWEFPSCNTDFFDIGATGVLLVQTTRNSCTLVGSNDSFLTSKRTRNHHASVCAYVNAHGRIELCCNLPVQGILAWFELVHALWRM